MSSKAERRFEDDLVAALATEPVVRTWLLQSATAQPIIKPYVTKLTAYITDLQQQVRTLQRERDGLQAQTEKQDGAIEQLRKKNATLRDQAASIGSELKRQRGQIAALQSNPSTQSASSLDSPSGPATKRRRVASAAGAAAVWADSATAPDAIVPEIGFQLPHRRRLTLQMVAGPGGGLRAVSAEGMVEFGIGWADILDIFCLPMPGKLKLTWNFVAVPKPALPTSLDDDSHSPPAESIMWAVTELSKKDLETGKATQPDGLIDQLNRHLGSLEPEKKVLRPDPEVFSARVEHPIRKGESATWVRAFKGTIEGVLFFLPTGIFFGFRKPVLFIPMTRIESVSYSNVVTRTFTVSVVYTAVSPDDPPDEVEFSMIDQGEHIQIDGYVQRFGLANASLSARHRTGSVDPTRQGEQSELDAAAAMIDPLDPAGDTDSDDEDFALALDSDGNPLDGTDGEGYTTSDSDDDSDAGGKARSADGSDHSDDSDGDEDDEESHKGGD